MAGEKLVSILLDAGRNATPNSEKTDLLYGRVVSVNPLKIQVSNESKLVLSESFLILSEFCKEKKVDAITLWPGLSVGDSVLMLRVLQGSKFYVLQKGDS